MEKRRIVRLLSKNADEISSLPTLHRIILGLLSKPLLEHLSTCNGLLDRSKVWGYTAIQWTLLRCDHNSLRALLEYESDEAIRRSLAEESMNLVRSTKCVNVLLATGAKIDAIVGTPLPGNGALMEVLHLTNDLRFIDLISYLLDCGADPQIRDTYYETTPVTPRNERLWGSCRDSRPFVSPPY